jgi:putative cofactor-binding repeat protein
MKNNIKLIGGFMLAISVGSVETTAATHIVLPGTSIQAKVDLAEAGDSIVILAGTYNESVTVNKQLDIKRAENAAVTINGSFTIDGLTEQFDLANLTIGADTGKKLIIKNCKYVNLSNIDLSKANGLEATTSKVTAASCKFGLDVKATAKSEIVLKDCTIGRDISTNQTELLLDNCTVARNIVGHGILRLVKTTVSGAVTCQAGTWTPVDTALPTECIIYQSTITENLATQATESWIGYNNLKSVSDIRNKGTIVGNTIDGRQSTSRGIYVIGGGTQVNIYNNIIRKQGEGQRNRIGIGIHINSNASCHISNNIIYECKVYYDFGGMGIYVESTKSTTITGNIIWDCYNTGRDHGDASVRAPFDNVLMKNNIFRKRGYKGGVIATEHQQDVDPKFVNQGEGDFTLQDDSPAKDAGSSEAWYNDRDGSRNDIGLYGGPFYDPDGKTTTKPVVLSAEIAPIQLIKGTDTEISFKSRGIVVP